MEYTILIVDDQADNIKVISSLLKEMGLGRKIYAAPNGKAALTLANQFLPDLILTDWQMPEMDGYELVKALKKSDVTKGIPIIMITGVKTDPVSMKASFDAGVHDYIRKPYDKLEFFARVSATLKLQEAFLTISRQHDELSTLSKFKDRLLTAISHDLRSPLVSLDGILRVFNDAEIELSSKELMEYTTLIQDEVGHTLALMDSLLFWAKTQIHELEIVMASFDIQLCIEDIILPFTQKIHQKNIRLINKITPGTFIKSNKNITSFIIRNLVDNAIKFSPVSGEVVVDLIASENYVEIQIADAGKGMDPQNINDFFSNKVTASHIGTSGEMGMGLGLKLCKDFAFQIKGSLSVISEKGKGSVFTLRIPKI